MMKRKEKPSDFPIDVLNGMRLDVKPVMKVVLLPDFYLDHFVMFEDRTFPEFQNVASPMIKRGGGSIPFIPHHIMRGGNAANCASALASLGAHVTLIVRTSGLGLDLLKRFMPSNIDLSRVKADGRLATTVALEFKKEKGAGLANVMIEDCGSVGDFDFEKLDSGDLKIIKEADYVGVFNWSQNKMANDLLLGVSGLLKKSKSQARLFFDSGDPSQRMNDVPALLSILEDPSRSRIRSFSLNENEAVLFASHYDRKIQRKASNREVTISKELALTALSLLGEKLRACERLDLHTSTYSASFSEGRLTECPAFTNIRALRATGAGDSFNAGDMIGDYLGLPDPARLLLANAVAASYLSNPEGFHPTLDELEKFIKKALHA